MRRSILRDTNFPSPAFDGSDWDQVPRRQAGTVEEVVEALAIPTSTWTSYLWITLTTTLGQGDLPSPSAGTTTAGTPIPTSSAESTTSSTTQTTFIASPSTGVSPIPSTSSTVTSTVSTGDTTTSTTSTKPPHTSITASSSTQIGISESTEPLTSISPNPSNTTDRPPTLAGSTPNHRTSSLTPEQVTAVVASVISAILSLFFLLFLLRLLIIRRRQKYARQRQERVLGAMNFPSHDRRHVVAGMATTGSPRTSFSVGNSLYGTGAGGDVRVVIQRPGPAWTTRLWPVPPGHPGRYTYTTQGTSTTGTGEGTTTEPGQWSVASQDGSGTVQEARTVTSGTGSIWGLPGAGRAY
ncbi:hypothetical protein F5Y15DRAFT_172293 [Xylariaceae sp. FL0016]|nr:hypothetical protein F5Y15DRAFT_172293 [Xylariaceae sp. FL0016]